MADLLQVIYREPGEDLVVDDGAHVPVRSFIVVFVLFRFVLFVWG